MIYNHNVKIVAFVGLAGSGKSTAADFIKEKGYPMVYFGGVILDKMKQLEIEDTAENEKIFREDIRAKEGKECVAKLIAEQIHSLINSGQHRIVADGLYSWTEYKYLKHEFSGELTTIAVVAAKKIRHRRLLNRPVRPLSQFEADQRDWAEIENLEKGGPIAIADHYIINDGDKEKLQRDLDAILLEMEFNS
ncbi:MAG: AAA family ATPase [Candidatus Saccharibacteria bacterium]